MLVMDTTADAVVGSAGEEDRAADSHDSTEGDGSGEEDGTYHAAVVHSEVEWPVWCSSCPGSQAGCQPRRGSHSFLTNAIPLEASRF